MRRTIIIGTAIAVLVGAAAAYAASLNTYTAGLSFSPGKAGSKSKPLALGLVESLGAVNATPASRAAPLVDIKTTIYGLKATGSKFPTCSNAAKMSSSKSDSFCPKKALVATGPVNALLGGTDLTQGGTACNPFLHVWNAGKGKVWFFFTTDAGHTCGSLHTGDTPAYPGFVKQSGKNLVIDVPLPSFVSTQVAFQKGLYGSLIKEKLTWVKGFQSSVACKSGTRPWSVAFTAVSTTQKETKTVSGTTKCS